MFYIKYYGKFNVSFIFKDTVKYTIILLKEGLIHGNSKHKANLRLEPV